MGCCGDREKQVALRAEQKWDYVNLDDFKVHSCFTPFAYAYLIIMLMVSISVYAVDTFTAINLLFFDRWAGQIKPALPLKYSRWIFAGCIILSFLLLIYRWVRAIRVIRQGGVANSYLDPLAIRLQSIRPGKEGRGWKRFLVFAELTKSRKGADYVALFSHYSFEAWLRVCFADGPRQAVNAITLYSVLQLNLIPVGKHAASSGHSPIVQFFVNVGILASSNRFQAVILFGMLWTLLIWVLAVLSLLVSVILYLVFLWHHIPAQDGGLRKYCRNKINRRMERIVVHTADKALKKDNQLRARAEAKAAKNGFEMKKQPTLPDLGALGDDFGAPISRQDTMTTLPEYSSRPQTSRNSNESLPSIYSAAPEMPTAFRPNPPRTQTQTSNESYASYQSSAPLLDNAAESTFSPYDHVQTPFSATSGPWPGRPAPHRDLSRTSDRSFGSAPTRSGSAQSGRNMTDVYPGQPGLGPGPASSFASRQMRLPPEQQQRAFPQRMASYDTAVTPQSTTSINSPWPGPHMQRSLEFQNRGGSAPPGRSYTPNGGPRSMTPHARPKLRPLRTSDMSNDGPGPVVATPTEARFNTPTSATGPYRSYSRDAERQMPYPGHYQAPRYVPNGDRRAPPRRRETQDSGLSDILDHY